MIIRTLLFLLFIANFIFTQEQSIIPLLKKIESGNIEEVKSKLESLKSENPNSGDVLFLDAVLTSDGESALSKYQKHFNSFPESKFADASLYRVFSYYYALGSYNKANELLDKLKTKYPNSPYINAASREIPDSDEDFSSLIEANSIEQNTTPDISNQPKQEIPPINTESIKTEPLLKSDSKKHFYLQTGAFLNIENAFSLKKRIENIGYQALIYPKNVGGSVLQVVLAGKFATKEDAEVIKPLINSKLNLNSAVVEYPE